MKFYIVNIEISFEGCTFSSLRISTTRKHSTELSSGFMYVATLQRLTHTTAAISVKGFVLVRAFFK